MPLFVRKCVDAEGNADGSQYMICTGSVSRDARTSETPQKHTPKVEFGVAYDSKMFMNVLAMGDRAATRLAACLEKGDDVIAVGTWRQRPYTTKDGEKKVWSELRADHVIPLGALEALLEIPLDMLYRLIALLPQLEAMSKGQMPTAQSAAAAAPQTAEMPGGFREVEDDGEPLPWDQNGGEDDDFELNI